MPASQALLTHLGALATYHEQAGDSLRKLISELVDANGAEPSASAPSAPAPAPTKEKKSSKAKASVTLDALREKMTEVIRECGRDEAVRLIKAQGAEKLADLPEDKFDALKDEAQKTIDAAKAKKDVKKPADDEL